MKLRHYLKGLGVGMVVTALILHFSVHAAEPSMTDEEVMARARELGMIENVVLSRNDPTISGGSTVSANENVVSANENAADNDESADGEDVELPIDGNDDNDGISDDITIDGDTDTDTSGQENDSDMVENDDTNGDTSGGDPAEEDILPVGDAEEIGRAHV